MDILRLFLFLGLILHKLLWEVLKRRGNVSGIQQRSSVKLHTRIVKFLKMLVLVSLVFQTLFLDVFPISDQPTPLRMIGTTIYLIGLATAVLGRLHLGENWVDLEDYRVLQGQAIVSSGMYRYIRHPIYTGDLLLLAGLELALNSWLVLSILILILIVIRQALREEALLSQKLPGYTEYCKRTKMFIPFVL